MWKMLLAALVAFPSLLTIESAGPSSGGKCDTAHITPIDLPMEELEKHPVYRVLYSTDFDPKTENETYYVKQVLAGRNYNMKHRSVFKNNSRVDFAFHLSFTDNVFFEDFVDKKGVRHQFLKLPLKMTSSIAILIYRCSLVGNPNEYYRLIIAPADTNPSESEIQELIDFDEATFGTEHGTLIKLS